MDVTFVIDDFGGEAESAEALAAGREPEEAQHLWGGIRFSHAGQPELLLRDDLSSMAPVLFGPVAAALREGRPVGLSMVAWPGDYDFEPQADGDQVRVSGSEGENASFPQPALLAALQACGQRLADFMAQLPQYERTAGELKKVLGG